MKIKCYAELCTKSMKWPTWIILTTLTHAFLNFSNSQKVNK